MKKLTAVLMAVLMLISLLTVPAFAAAVPSEEEIKEIFKDLGISTWGSGYFGCNMMNPEGDPATEDVVHQYIQTAGLLKGYEAEWEVTNEYATYMQQGYELPYTRYIEIIDSVFVNHTDMKSYLNSEWNNYYDENTGMVKWGTGGFGGPSDWVLQEVSYGDDIIYATGVMVELAYDDSDFMGLTENLDYVTVTGDYGTSKGMLVEPIILTLKNEDGEWKILEYRENTWHIADGILYDIFERVKMYPIELNYEGAQVEASDDSVEFTTSYYGNYGKWYTEKAELSYNITAKTGYTLKNVTLKDDKGTNEIKPANGVYIVIPEGKAVLSVNTVRTPVDIELSSTAEDKTMKVAQNNTDVFANVNQSVKDISSSIKEEVEVINADGTKAKAEDKIASGMQIIVKDDKGNAVDFKTVVVPGDVDGDAAISSTDARSALRAAVGLDTLKDWSGSAADIDGASGIAADDARSILRASVGLDKTEEWLTKVV